MWSAFACPASSDGGSGRPAFGIRPARSSRYWRRCATAHRRLSSEWTTATGSTRPMWHAPSSLVVRSIALRIGFTTFPRGAVGRSCRGGKRCLPVFRAVSAGFRRLDEPANIALHTADDRRPLSIDRLTNDIGFRCNFDLNLSVDDYFAWARTEGAAEKKLD